MNGWLWIKLFWDTLKELNLLTLTKTYLGFHSGIEPSRCDVFFWKILFWNWTTFLLTKLTFWMKMTHGCLICSTPLLFLFRYVFFATDSTLFGQHLLEKGGHTQSSTPKQLRTTSDLWKTQLSLFTRKTTLLSLLSTSPYTYPWKHSLFWKWLFCEEIWALF